MGNQIHWFPGHMKKALEQIKERIKLIDVIVEVLDARAPFSSINEEFEKLVANKKRVALISKCDLADSKITLLWVEYLKNKFDIVVTADLTSNKVSKIITDAVFSLGKEKREKDIKKGMKPQPIKTMIIGVPNAGKSSLINRFAKKNVAGVRNIPGFTKGEQFIKVNNDFILLDTPGVLPMNYEDKIKATNLALIGSIKEDILPIEEVDNYLLSYLKENYPKALLSRFKIETIIDDNKTFESICKCRGLLDSKGGYDLLKAQKLLLKEFKEGKLGAISLEKPL